MNDLKTWEMIKALTENPKQTFVRVGNDRPFKLSTKIEGGKVTDYYISNITNTTSQECILLKDEWELVREPVDFMAAINSGKAIKYESYRGGFKGQGYWLAEHPFSLEILNGKWYIE